MKTSRYQILVLWILDFILTGLVGMYLWNHIVAVIFGTITLSFAQTWAITVCWSYWKHSVNTKKSDDTADLLVNDIFDTIAYWLFGFICTLFI